MYPSSQFGRPAHARGPRLDPCGDGIFVARAAADRTGDATAISRSAALSGLFDCFSTSVLSRGEWPGIAEKQNPDEKPGASEEASCVEAAAKARGESARACRAS